MNILRHRELQDKMKEAESQKLFERIKAEIDRYFPLEKNEDAALIVGSHFSINRAWIAEQIRIKKEVKKDINPFVVQMDTMTITTNIGLEEKILDNDVVEMILSMPSTRRHTFINKAKDLQHKEIFVSEDWNVYFLVVDTPFSESEQLISLLSNHFEVNALSTLKDVFIENDGVIKRAQ